MSTETKTQYEAAVETRRRVEEELRAEEKRHTEVWRKLQAQLTMLNRQIDVADAGLCSAEDVARGQTLLDVTWHPFPVTGRQRTPEVNQQFASAIRDVQENCPVMRREYLGVKAYDRWRSQIEDHEYGFGPRHGSIWFSIGLTAGARKIGVFEPETRQSLVRYLRAVEKDPEVMLG